MSGFSQNKNAGQPANNKLPYWIRIVIVCGSVVVALPAAAYLVAPLAGPDFGGAIFVGLFVWPVAGPILAGLLVYIGFKLAKQTNAKIVASIYILAIIAVACLYAYALVMNDSHHIQARIKQKNAEIVSQRCAARDHQKSQTFVKATVVSVDTSNQTIKFSPIERSTLEDPNQPYNFPYCSDVTITASQPGLPTKLEDLKPDDQVTIVAASGYPAEIYAITTLSK